MIGTFRRENFQNKKSYLATPHSISFPEAAILLVSGRGSRPLARGDFESANHGLPVTLPRIKGKPKMAESSVPDTFLEGVKYALEKVGKANVTLKQKQEEILKIIALKQKDVLVVLPTGYGKSLIYQIIPPLMDYMDSGQRPTQKKSVVLVVSPLNALIRNQVTKLKQSGLKVCILRGDRVEGDEEKKKRRTRRIGIQCNRKSEGLSVHFCSSGGPCRQ